MRLDNKRIVVTGAGGGIGSQLVIKLLQKNVQVIATDLSQDSLKKLEQRIKSDKLITKQLDIANKSSVKVFSEDIIRTFGDIDGVINCAGIIQPFVKVKDLDYQTIDKLMQINFYGTVYTTKSLLPHLLDRPEAIIVNISSMGGFLPVPGQAFYGASKAAVKLFTEALYTELQNTNVKVCLVFPGATNTNIANNSKVKIPYTPKNQKKYNAIDPAITANQIIKGIEKDKAQLFIGKDSKSMNILYRLNPSFATKLISKKMQSLLSD